MGHSIVGIGLTGKVEIIGYPEYFIKDFNTVIEELSETEAGIEADIWINEGFEHKDALTAKTVIFDECGEKVATETAEVKNGAAKMKLTIADPKLWWPRGYGRPYLYTVVMSISDEKGEIHTLEKCMGLRKVELVLEKPNGRKTYQLRVNDTDVYVFGGNMMPIDCLNSYGTEDQYKNLFKLAENANINLIRIWGGGVNETDQFLDMCDKKGFMIWNDFHFHSCTYPDYDADFMADVEKESTYLVKQLRKHPCFTLICGGNEQQEGWDAWNWKGSHDRFYGEKLIYELLPHISQKYCPEIPYIPNSPYGEKLGQSPVDGDTHTWGNFYNATKDPQFVTETCWFDGTYSKPETLEETMGIDVDHYDFFGWHKEWRDLTSLDLIGKTQYSEYHMARSLREYMKTLEIEQTEADRKALYMLRCRSSSCNGIIYWPLNKGGPLFNYGCIDYHGRPIMPFYNLKRVFADVVVNAYRDIDDIRIVASNAGSSAFNGTLEITHIDTAGNVLKKSDIPVSFTQGNSIRLHTMEGYYQAVADRWKELINVKLLRDGETITEDNLIFCPLFELETHPGNIGCDISKIDSGKWLLELETDAFTKMIEIEPDVRMILTDNYFMLMPKTKKKVVLTLADGRPKTGAVINIGSIEGDKPLEIRLL